MLNCHIRGKQNNIEKIYFDLQADNIFIMSNYLEAEAVFQLIGNANFAFATKPDVIMEVKLAIKWESPLESQSHF